MIERIVMDINEILAWSHEETQVGDSLADMLGGLPAEMHPVVKKQVEKARRRARWLDQQVQFVLEAADDDQNSEERPGR